MKRTFDILVALSGLLLGFPVMLIIGFWLQLVEGDCFFFQRRKGYKEKFFTIYKFRTMKKGKEPERILGAEFIRSLGFDSFPELVNVLKGDMSIIGPRPLCSPYYEEMEKLPEALTRYQTKPGMLGLAQIYENRPNPAPVERLVFDLQYVAQESFSLDLKIFWLGMKKTILRRPW